MIGSARDALVVLQEARERLGGEYPPGATLLLVWIDRGTWRSSVIFDEPTRLGFSPLDSGTREGPLGGAISCEPRPGHLVDLGAPPGTRIEGEGGAGTIGWNLRFGPEKALAFVTSRHVVVADVTAAFAPSRPPLVTVRSRPARFARVRWSPILSPSVQSVFDVAVCEYINSAAIPHHECRDEGIAWSLSSDARLGDDRFWCVTASSGSRTGTLVAVGDVLIDYAAAGGLQWLQSQLLFDLPIAAGDSGALIVKAGDRSATGLVCARTTYRGYVAVNPLFTIGWDVGVQENGRLAPAASVPHGGV